MLPPPPPQRRRLRVRAVGRAGNRSRLRPLRRNVGPTGGGGGGGSRAGGGPVEAMRDGPVQARSFRALRLTFALNPNVRAR